MNGQQARIEALTREAKARCEGCRLSWRLDGWRHREPAPFECKAKSVRQELRDVARSGSAFTMTERQIEAAAKAIYREAGWDRKWRDITESGRERFRKAARAALRAANRTHGERAQDTKEG